MNRAVAALALGALVAGCGGGGGENQAATTTGPAATTGAAVPCPEDPGAAPGDVGAEEAAEVTATLTEYGIRLEPSSVPAGRVRFRVVDSGEEGHELLVLAGGDAGALPTDLTGGLDRARLAPGVVAAALPAIGPGATCTLTADLAAGPYLTVCSLTNAESGANHFPAGMLAPLEVTN